MSKGDDFLEKFDIKDLKEVEEHATRKRRKVKQKAKLETGQPNRMSRDPSKESRSKSNDRDQSCSARARADTQQSRKTIVSVFFEWYDMYLRSESQQSRDREQAVKDR